MTSKLERGGGYGLSGRTTKKRTFFCGFSKGNTRASVFVYMFVRERSKKGREVERQRERERERER